MRVLWLKTELLHPLDKGGKIRTYHMVRALSRLHEVTYLTLDDGSGGPDAVEKSKEYAQHVVSVPFKPPPRRSVGFYRDLARNLFSTLPYAIARYRSHDFTREAARLVRDSDLVVCDFLPPSVNLEERLPARSVLFEHNVEAEIWRRHAETARNPAVERFFRSQWSRMKRYEQAVCRRFDHVVTVSDLDADHIRGAYGVKSVSSIPTGVDTEFFGFTEAERRRPDRMVFLGSMDWMPNEDGVHWFVESVLPAIRASRPGATLDIVGRAPGPGILALDDEASGVRVTGTVPDVRPFLDEASLFVVPLRVGGGTRLKIFEAMSSGVPVVSTTIGAEGLPLTDREHLVITDSAQAMATACAELLADRQCATEMARRAAAYVRARFGWEDVARQFIEACT